MTRLHWNWDWCEWNHLTILFTSPTITHLESIWDAVRFHLSPLLHVLAVFDSDNATNETVLVVSVEAVDDDGDGQGEDEDADDRTDTASDLTEKGIGRLEVISVQANCLTVALLCN